MLYYQVSVNGPVTSESDIILQESIITTDLKKHLQSLSIL